eukprot:CFRG5183T1
MMQQYPNTMAHQIHAAGVMPNNALQYRPAPTSTHVPNTNANSVAAMQMPAPPMPRTPAIVDHASKWKGWKERYAVDYGLRVVSVYPPTGLPLSVACRFCEVFGRESRGIPGKRKRITHQTWGKCVNSNVFTTHNHTSHRARFGVYRTLTREGKLAYFPEDGGVYLAFDTNGSVNTATPSSTSTFTAQSHNNGLLSIANTNSLSAEASDVGVHGRDVGIQGKNVGAVSKINNLTTGVQTRGGTSGAGLVELLDTFMYATAQVENYSGDNPIAKKLLEKVVHKAQRDIDEACEE